MADTVNRVLVEAVEARDALIKRLAVDLADARSVAYSNAIRVSNLTNGTEGGYQTLPWDANYRGVDPSAVSTRELNEIRERP